MEEQYQEAEIIHEEAVAHAREAELPLEAYQDLALLFRLFGDSTRLRILYALEQQEMCGCDLAALLGVTKSAVSHQLKSLRLSRLVKYRKDGQNVYYSLADDHVKKIVEMGLEHISE